MILITNLLVSKLGFWLVAILAIVLAAHRRKAMLPFLNHQWRGPDRVPTQQIRSDLPREDHSHLTQEDGL